MIVKVSHLRFAYDKRTVLDGINFSMEAGEFLSVLGPNGVGKSTLFRCILGILKQYQGEILVKNKNIRTMSRREMAHAIAYIPQIHRPTFGYSVLDTVLMGTAHTLSPMASPKKEQILAAWEALEEIGIGHLADRNFAYLSGGEQQLTLVARAIAQKADLLIMDEPTSALDYGNQIRVLEKVKQLTEKGYAVLLSTHNPQHALLFSQKILALKDGGIAAYGAPEAVLDQALMKNLYDIQVEFLDTAQGRVILPCKKADEK